MERFMAPRWILVANRTLARLFLLTDKSTPLVLLREFHNDEGKLRNKELQSDKPGRSTDNRARARHSYSQEEDARERVLANFCRTVSGHLNAEQHAGKFSKLIIFAEPQVLGNLRDNLSPGTDSTVGACFAKDLCHEDATSILERVREIG